MDLAQILTNLPVMLIPIALIVYYTNQNNIKWMAERNDLVKSLLAERKEWLDWQAATIERQFVQQEKRFEIQERVALAMESLKTEMHNLRGKIAEVLGRYELASAKKSKADDDK